MGDMAAERFLCQIIAGSFESPSAAAATHALELAEAAFAL
jgi:hypothetical protein